MTDLSSEVFWRLFDENVPFKPIRASITDRLFFRLVDHLSVVKSQRRERVNPG